MEGNCHAVTCQNCQAWTYRTETKRFLRQTHWDEWRVAALCITRGHFIHGEINHALHFQTSDYKCATNPPSFYTHQGSNSWMMLSKRITAKSRELNPANQARKRMVNDSKDCHPAGCVSPPDRPPPLHPAGELGRPLPETEPPALELALCLQSEAVWCSAMFWRIWLGKHFPPPRTPLSTNPLPPRRQYFCATRPSLQLQVFDVV